MIESLDVVNVERLLENIQVKIDKELLVVGQVFVLDV